MNFAHKVRGPSNTRRGSDAEQSKGMTTAHVLRVGFLFASAWANLREHISPKSNWTRESGHPEWPGADLCNLMGKCRQEPRSKLKKHDQLLGLRE